MLNVISMSIVWAMTCRTTHIDYQLSVNHDVDVRWCKTTHADYELAVNHVIYRDKRPPMLNITFVSMVWSIRWRVTDIECQLLVSHVISNYVRPPMLNMNLLSIMWPVFSSATTEGGGWDMYFTMPGFDYVRCQVCPRVPALIVPRCHAHLQANLSESVWCQSSELNVEIYLYSVCQIPTVDKHHHGCYWHLSDLTVILGFSRYTQFSSPGVLRIHLLPFLSRCHKGRMKPGQLMFFCSFEGDWWDC